MTPIERIQWVHENARHCADPREGVTLLAGALLDLIAQAQPKPPAEGGPAPADPAAQGT